MLTSFASDLPKGWVLTRVGNVIETVSLTGKKLKKRDYGDEGKLPVIDQGMSLIGGYSDDENLKLECQLPVIVFGDHTKTIKYVDFDFIPGADGIKVIKPIKIYFPKLFYYFIRAIPLPDKGYARHFQFLEKSQIPIPPMPEQQRIVAKLETLFTQLGAAVDSLKKAQTQLQRYRQSLLKTAFEGELTKEWREGYAEKGGKDIGECVDSAWIEWKGSAMNKTTSPEHWEVVQLKEIVNLRREKVQPKDSSKNLNFVGLKHIDSGVSILKRWEDASEAKSAKARFYPNDVLYGKLRPYLDKAVIAEVEGICSADILVFTANSKTIPRFLVYLLHSRTFRSYAIATSSGITLPRTSWDALGKFTFALPPLSEQEQIVSELERHLSAADEAEATIGAELTRAERLRQSILKHAFSGKLVPQDPNDEPATVLLEKIQEEKEHQQPKRRKKTTKSKTQDSDNYPLLALARALECNVPERHDD